MRVLCLGTGMKDVSLLIFPVEVQKKRIQMIDDEQRPIDGGGGRGGDVGCPTPPARIRTSGNIEPCINVAAPTAWRGDLDSGRVIERMGLVAGIDKGSAHRMRRISLIQPLWPWRG